MAIGKCLVKVTMPGRLNDPPPLLYAAEGSVGRVLRSTILRFVVPARRPRPCKARFPVGFGSWLLSLDDAVSWSGCWPRR